MVTANKALLAVHGTEIFAAAREKGVMVAFEAAVAGGIPIIKALREGLTANRIEWIAGIINGTTNFILSEMRDKGLDFATALKEAQALGYAEADPTFDIEGVDAAHKATIMSAIAFGMPVQFDKAYVEGISKLQRRRHPLRRAARLSHQAAGHRQRRTGGHEGIELRVHPTLIPAKRLIANVEGAMNAVLVQGDAVGTHAVLRQGRGRRADRFGGDRRPGRHHPPAHGRPGPPRAAPGVPAGRLPTRRSCRSTKSSTSFLPAPAGRGRGRRAGRHHAHPGRQRHLDRRAAAERSDRREGKGETDIILLTHETVEGR